jgi:hypothetical protein
MTLSIIGAGLGRTGTLSLKLALERLGFGPCYHMREVREHHLQDHVPLWMKAAAGRFVDWDLLFQDYRSAVDFPAAAFYRDLADHYPAAKVILTVRDRARWYESFIATIRNPMTSRMPDGLAQWGDMVHKVIVEHMFGGDVTDQAHVIACYERHNEEVKRTIPSARLLVYDVLQGWLPLCDFLGVAFPDEPFPKVNTTAEFQERIAPLFRT